MYQMADVIAIIVEDVKPQCNMLQQLADDIARWQMKWPPQGVLVNTGRCYYQVTDGLLKQLPDVIAKWQIE